MLTTDASPRSREINWDYVGDAIPAFLTIIIIPLTYNIAYGVIAGIFSYILLNGTAWGLRKVSGGRIVPPNYDLAEKWVVPPGGITPGWVKALRRGRNPPAEEPAQVGHEQHLEKEPPSIDEHTKGSSEASR